MEESSENVPEKQKQKKKSRNVIDGKTRVLPVPEWKAQEQNALKRVKRLANKVKRFSSETAFPPMGFFYIHAGAVHAFGHEQSCKIFFSKENIQKLDVTVMDTEVTQKDDKPTIDIRNIDLDIDFNNVKINTLRQSYSQLSFNKGAGERSTYKVENRPPYWPEDIPFVSHSKRKGDGSGRIITSDMMVKCLDSFKEYCIEGVQAGFIPINVPETYDILKITPVVREEKEIKKEHAKDEEDAQDKVENEEIEVETDVEGENTSKEEYNVENEEIEVETEVEGKSTSKEEYNVENEEIEVETEVEGASISKEEYNTAEKQISPLAQAIDKKNASDIIRHIVSQNFNTDLSGLESCSLVTGEIQFQPRKRPLRTYNGPDILVPGEGRMSVFDLLNIFPDFAKIAVYLFAKSHLDHYVQQYHKVDMDNIKKALNNRGQSKTVRDLLIEEAKNLLTDEKIGPAALMFTAGYLRKELVIHNEEGVTDYLCACPCAEGVEVQHIYHDKGDNFYPLSHKDLWRADGPSTRSKIPDNYQTLEEDNKGCLPGMESDSVIFRRYGHEIWQGDLNRLSKGHWLDDSLVYVAIRHHQETYATEDIYTFDPVFSRKLLAKENCPDDGSRLILHSCNIDLVNAYSRRIAFEEKRLILIPICDNTHWILASFCPKTFTVTIMCSMGGCYRKTAQSLGRYFAAMYAKSFEDVKISHAKVQKQQNGNDCGVFVVGYAECLMKNGNLADWKVKGRSQLLKIIKKMY